MKQLTSLAATAAVILWSMALAHAATKPATESSRRLEKAAFERIDEWCTTVSEAADNLGYLATRQADPESHLDDLDIVQSDINRIGKELTILEDERNSLADWEVQALDQILPLMHDAAEHAEKAIRVYNSERPRLWATSYADDAGKVATDTGRAANLIRDYLRLQTAHNRELRIERDLGEALQP
jgi:hypothetical protein